MANKFDNNEALAFQEEEVNLSRVENLLDGLISRCSRGSIKTIK